MASFHRAAIDEIWPSSRRQRIREQTAACFAMRPAVCMLQNLRHIVLQSAVAAKVQSALEEVLMHNPTFREQLVGVCGFTVRAV